MANATHTQTAPAKTIVTPTTASTAPRVALYTAQEITTMGAWLRITRKAEGLSVAQVAELMKSFGWNRKVVDNTESGIRSFRREEWEAWVGITGKVPPATVAVKFSNRTYSLPGAAQEAPALAPSAPVVAIEPIPAPEPTFKAEEAVWVPCARDTAVQQAAALMSNTRLTDDEVTLLVGMLKAKVTALLLGGL